MFQSHEKVAYDSMTVEKQEFIRRVDESDNLYESFLNSCVRVEKKSCMRVGKQGFEIEISLLLCHKKYE